MDVTDGTDGGRGPNWNAHAHGIQGVKLFTRGHSPPLAGKMKPVY